MSEAVIDNDQTNAIVGDGIKAPYIPWKSLEGFVKNLKDTHAPDVIDSGVMPTTMGGGLQRQVRAALKFLGLTNNQGKVSEGFNELIEAHGTPQWPIAVKEHVLPAYEPIIGDLAIERATASQLDNKFKDFGTPTGQMLDKAVRFYLHALKNAGIKYSSYWNIRKDTRPKRPSSGPKQPAAKGDAKPEGNKDQTGSGRRDSIDGLIEFPLHFGDGPTGKILVPAAMNEDDVALFDAMVAVVKAYATRKKASTK